MPNITGAGVLYTEFGERDVGYNVTFEDGNRRVVGWLRPLGGKGLEFPGTLVLGLGERFLVRSTGTTNSLRDEWQVEGVLLQRG